jgi:GNAT superfamily N-acetyltransferase
MAHLPPQFRLATPTDVARCIDIRGRTRENAVSAERLAAVGITAESWSADVATGRLCGYVSTIDNAIVGYCFGNSKTGKVVVLALLPRYEGLGLGKSLLSRVVQELASIGHHRLFLGCSRDPTTRSHGFYRHLGWRPTGTLDARDDEVLELNPES